MINTIFYFVATDAEYLEKRAAGEISNKTITFVEDTREIYLNGRGYGKTSTAGLLNNEEFNAWKEIITSRLNTIINDASNANQQLVERWLKELDEAVEDLEQRVQAAISDTSSVSAELQEFRNELKREISDAITDAITNANGRTIWNEITRVDSGVSSVTTKLDGITDSNGNIKYTSALQSVINTGISNNEAITNISNRYAVLDENQEVIEWLASGFKSQAAEGGSFATVFAAATGSGSEALSALKTEILQESDNRYTAKANLSTEVVNLIKNGLGISALADIALQSDIDAATATISTRFDGVDTSIASLLAQSNDDHSRIQAITSLGDNNTIIFNESKLDSAIAGILADSNSRSTARVQLLAESESSGVDITSAIENAVAGFATQTYVDTSVATVTSNLKDASGNIITSSSLRNDVNANSAKLTALAEWNGWHEGDPVNYKGGVVTEANADGVISALVASANSDVKAAITAAIEDHDSSITLSADKIYLDAETTLANTILATQGTIANFNITADGLTSAQGIYNIELTPAHFATYKNNVISNEIRSDGSGSIASGGISWKADGSLVLSQDFLRSLLEALGQGSSNGLTYGGVSETIISEADDCPGSKYLPDGIAYYKSGLTTGGITIFDGINSNTGNPNPITSAGKGSVIVYDATITDDPSQFPINGTLSDKVTWLLSKWYKRKLIFDRGLLTSREKIDAITLKTASELTSSDISGRVYKYVGLPSASNFAAMLLAKTGKEFSTSKYKGYYSHSNGKRLLWSKSVINVYYYVYDGDDVEDGDWCVSSNNTSIGLTTNTFLYNATSKEWEPVSGGVVVTYWFEKAG